MTDQRMRELERRFQESGSVEDEAAWLVVRRRQGDVSEETLRLAAHLRHEPARLALVELDDAFDWKASQSITLAAWAEALGRWGREACVRAAIGACHPALERCGENAVLAPPASRPALRTVELWSLAPGPDRQEAVRELLLHSSSLPDFLQATVKIITDDDPAPATRRAIAIAASYPGTFVALEAIRREVVPWCLGYADPVRGRVA